MRSKAYFISGTDTDVGKTLISTALLLSLKLTHHEAAYFKPVLSGGRRENGCLIPEDTEFALRAAALTASDSPLVDCYNAMTPYIFEEALSPHLAARRAQRLIDPDHILKSLDDLHVPGHTMIIEGAGGIACPLIENEEGFYMTSDLIHALEVPVILVCRAGLGTLSHTATAVAYCRQQGLTVKGLIVNGYEAGLACDDNLKALPKLTGLPILAVMPKLNWSDTESLEQALQQYMSQPNIARQWANVVLE